MTTVLFGSDLKFDRISNGWTNTPLTEDGLTHMPWYSSRRGLCLPSFTSLVSCYSLVLQPNICLEYSIFLLASTFAFQSQFTWSAFSWLSRNEGPRPGVSCFSWRLDSLKYSGTWLPMTTSRTDLWTDLHIEMEFDMNTGSIPPSRLPGIMPDCLPGVGSQSIIHRTSLETDLTSTLMTSMSTLRLDRRTFTFLMVIQSKSTCLRGSLERMVRRCTDWGGIILNKCGHMSLDCYLTCNDLLFLTWLLLYILFKNFNYNF